MKAATEAGGLPRTYVEVKERMKEDGRKNGASASPSAVHDEACVGAGFGLQSQPQA